MYIKGVNPFPVASRIGTFGLSMTAFALLYDDFSFYIPFGTKHHLLPPGCISTHLNGV
jgi:hypothetical protein